MKENKEKDEKDSVEAKAILIGDAGVGKTSLIRAASNQKFIENLESNLTANCTEKKIKIDSLNYSVNLWDTAGQEKYIKVNSIFYRGSDIVIFVFDVNVKQSFKNLDKWIANVKDNTDSKSNYVCGIVGNKKDLIDEDEDEQQIIEKMGKEYAKKNNMKFKMVSAKTDPLGFNKFLEELVKDAKNNLLNKEEYIHLKEHLKIEKKCNC